MDVEFVRFVSSVGVLEVLQGGLDTQSSRTVEEDRFPRYSRQRFLFFRGNCLRQNERVSCGQSAILEPFFLKLGPGEK